ncbi:macrophage-expressed gene 1 protein-like [Mercenaria mercenaria]|uniref:macrophage-expressed gene 1 protein-like n=1 Tax=Mercenaria mercenaria TaxID=6596 RepID=UPI00234F4B06|nr:macrophage-expressed gene 1 protein-like [Mercenaria mercenaria]
MKSAFVLLCLACLPLVILGAINDFVYPVGDPRRCFEGMNSQIVRFEVIPGGGWDNLRNKELGMVMGLNYSRCKTTEDGRFLIPDGTRTVPQKNSKIDSYAELIEHWDDFTSTLSRTINVGAGGAYDGVAISGKFSDEYEEVKSKQYNDKTATTRLQVRYVQYTVNMEPDTPLNEAFKARLRKIAAHLTLNRTDMARFESQLLVRDFGTHVTTSLDVGAALVQTDELSADYVKDHEQTKQTILAAASANFFGIVNFDVGYSQTSQQSDTTAYAQSRTSSKVMAFGGPIFRPMNFTANNWTDAIQTDLVALDRSGDPIYYVINDRSLPNVHQSVIQDVYDLVQDAVNLYYEHNIRRGCTNPESPNFSFPANYDDGTCMPPMTNFSFGGVYQECSGNGSDLCKGMAQNNPKTGSASCPNGYKSMLLNHGLLQQSKSNKECHTCWLFFQCCHWVTDSATAEYSAYWCAATGKEPPDSGYLFGGLYTSNMVNSYTKSRSCPKNYYPLQILSELTVCVSDDYEQGYEYSLAFAGFFTCRRGNPLAQLENDNSTGKTSQLASYMTNAGVYPHACPKGYSQHLATVDNQCNINYCIKTGNLSEKSLPKVLRPPFMKAPRDGYMDVLDTAFVVNSDGDLWTIKERAKKDVPMFLEQLGLSNYITTQSPTQSFSEEEHGHYTSPRKLSSRWIAFISVSATLLCILVGSGIIVTMRRRRNRNSDLNDHQYMIKHTYGKMGDTPKTIHTQP